MEFLPTAGLRDFQGTNSIYWLCLPTTKISFCVFAKFNSLMYSMLGFSPPTIFPLSLHFLLPVIAHSSSQLSCQTNFEFRPRNDLRSLILPPPHQHVKWSLAVIFPSGYVDIRSGALVICFELFLEFQSANRNFTCLSKENNHVIWWLDRRFFDLTEAGEL